MKFKSEVQLEALNNATVDTDKFLVSDGDVVKYRTGAQLLSDIGSGVFVPYTGATSDVNLGEFGVQLGNLEFDLTPTNTPTTAGSMYWNDTDGTADLILKGGNVTLQIGQETVARVVNKTATDITLLEANYQAVRVTGAQGQRPKVDLAQADNDLDSASTLGLVTETILINQEGFITTSGQVREINTTGSLQGETWLDGDILYLSGTVAGRITNIKPIAPIHTVIIGFVEYAHAIHGKIFVKVNNGYELEELHNVSAVAPNNNEVLVYDTPSLLWMPKTIPAILGYTPANDANVVHKTGNESITGTKTFSNSTSNPAITVSNSNNGSQGIFSTNTSVGSGIYSGNSSSGTGITSSNGSTGNGIYSGNGGTGTGIFSYNGGTGIGIFSENITSGINAYLTNVGSGKNLVLNNTSTGTGMPFTIQKIGVDKLTISDSGDIKGNKVILGTTVDNLVDTLQVTGYSIATGYKIPSGLSSWFLKADGTYDSSTYVPTSRTLTINGVTQDLSANRTFTVSGSMSIGGTITSATAGSVLFAGIGGVLQQDNSQFFWDDTNNRLGLGITIPAEKLDVSGNIKMSGGGSRTLIVEASGAGGTEIRLLPNTTAGYARINVGNTSQPLDFQMNSANVMRITQAGNVGIGTTSPAFKLQVKTPTLLIGSKYSWPFDLTRINDTQRGFSIGLGVANEVVMGSHNSDMAFGHTFGADTNGNPIFFETMRIQHVDQAVGNVGIGTTSPTSGKLQVLRTDIGWSGWIENSAVEGSGLVVTGGSDSGGLSMLVRKQNGTNTFAVNGNGNVGIGTTSPLQKLHVEGSSYHSSDLYTYNNGGIFFSGNGTFTSGILQNAAGLCLQSGGQLRLAINSSGNVGIGTTTIGSSIQVNGNAAIGYSASTVAPASGLVVNGNVGIGTTTIGSKLQINGNAAIGFSASIAAPANGMLVSGNVGIGTTSPSNNLHVIGTVRVDSTATTTPGINVIAQINSTAYYQTPPTTLTNQNFALFQTRGTINGGITKAGLFVSHGTSQIQGITTPTPELYLGQLNKNNVWIFGCTAAQGASQINSRLQVGYDQFLPDVANTNTLSVGGNGYFTSTVSATGFVTISDNNLKDIISKNGDTVRFTWKNKQDNQVHIGYIAQEIQKIYPDQVHTSNDGTLSVNYIEVLVAKLQDLTNEIKELKNKITILENK